jgi:hypothetical protein
MVALRQRPTTEVIRSRLILLPESGRVMPDGPLFGRSSADNSLKRMHVGSATATPKANTSRVPREGINEIRLAAASETAERTNAWSHSFDNRMTNSVGGKAGTAMITFLDDLTILAGAKLLIGHFCQRNGLRKNFDFLVDTRPAAKEDVDDLLEIEQPKRQTQILRRQRMRLAAETASILVVRIDQEDAQVRSCFQDLLQDDGDTARHADAGRAEDGKMPAH